MSANFIIDAQFRKKRNPFKDPSGIVDLKNDKLMKIVGYYPPKPEEPKILPPEPVNEEDYKDMHLDELLNARDSYLLAMNAYEKALKDYLDELEKWNNSEATPIYEPVENSTLTTLPADHFSFRNVGAKRIYIFPPFLCNDSVGSSFNADISNRLIYGFSKESPNTKSVDLVSDILNNIPGIELREYQADYKIDQIINLMQKFYEGFSKATEASTSAGDSTAKVGESIKAEAEKAKEIFKKFWKLILDLPSLAKKIVAGLAKAPLSNGYKDDTIAITLPYIFYYRLMGYTTTNYYTIPFSGNMDIIESDGMTGWSGNQWFDPEASLPGGKMIGKMIAGFIKNVRVHRNPLWNPDLAAEGCSYNIKFSLYNYSIDAAINNYIFVNTIIPGNMSLQYGLLHNSPSLYDVKIEGGPRMFCCSGKFKCTYKGPLRSVPSEFVKAIVGKYGNLLTDQASAISKNLIKIPDVYNIDCTFKSMLPNNYNEYIWRFALPGMEGPGQGGIGVHTQDIYADVLDKAADAFKALAEGAGGSSGGNKS